MPIGVYPRGEFSDAEFFEQRVTRTNSCWLWVGSKYKNGYGSSLLFRERREDPMKIDSIPIAALRESEEKLWEALRPKHWASANGTLGIGNTIWIEIGGRTHISAVLRAVHEKSRKVFFPLAKINRMM